VHEREGGGGVRSLRKREKKRRDKTEDFKGKVRRREIK
jgi:hypothetical protein